MSQEFARRVVVTGADVVTSAGNGLAALWRAILEERSAEGLLPEFDRFAMKSKIFGAARGFDAETVGLPDEVSQRTDRYTHLAFAAARGALEQSGLLEAEIDSERVG